MQRTCKTAHWYADRERTPGEVYEVRDEDVKALLAMGHIERAPGDPDIWPHGAANEYQTRDMGAARQRRQTITRRAA